MTPGPEEAPTDKVDETDMELIRRWKAGDSRAATRLVGRHSQALARFAASSGEREGIEELVQDTFVRAFASLDSFRGESSLRTWLFTIERRLMLDRRRAERRSRETVPIEDADRVSEYGALDGLIAAEAQERVRQSLNALSPTQREVFTLRVQQGLSYKEIAEIVGTTEGAARVHYHNAIQTVKEYLRDE
jgi:RNA polymerase sigma-70 factor (ECF subfamily)